MPNVSVPLIEIPQYLITDRNHANACRAMAALALKENQAPVEVALRGLPRKSIFFTAAMSAKVEQAAAGAQMTFQEAFAGLMQAGIELAQASRREMDRRIIEAAPPPFRVASDNQVRFFQNIMASLDAGRVCMAEGSTGVGKSRAMVMAAIKQAEKKKRPVVIAAPTLKVLGQLWGEWEHLRNEGLGKQLVAGFFPGATEFVDREQLIDYLGGAELPDKAVSQWVAEGGQCQYDSPLVRAMKASGHDLSFLMEDLRHLATNLAPDDFRARTIEDHEDMAKVREFAANSDILFCTHAMLGRAHQSSWAVFPQPDVLIIDEAHLFEQSIANLLSCRVSLYALRHRLKQCRDARQASSGTTVSKAYKSVARLIALFRSTDIATDRAIRLGDEHQAQFADGLTELVALLKSQTLKDVERIAEARSVIAKTIKIMNGEAGRAYLEFSPDRRFPSLSCGQSSVGGFLGDLWRTAQGGVVIASATLYAPDRYGNSKCDYMADILALPRSRLDTPPPVVAEWVTSVPVLYTPSGELARQLGRAHKERRNEETEKIWLDNLTAAIGKVAEQAEGGTLVLLTSYAQVTRIQQCLAYTDRVVAQSSDEKFTKTEQRFRSLHAEGLRPIFLAVGTAWTGVDLTDKSVPPHEDRMLTDLVIGCIPVGLNRTTTMQARIERRSIEPIIQDTLMMLRQGFGRLMRNPNMRDKNIWVLDGRLFGEWPHMDRLLRSAQKILGSYRYRREISPGTVTDTK